MNSTHSSNRIHIGFFGRRNAGKSSLVNAVTNQSMSIVSDAKGTTTDPVRKAMELLPLGPVLIIDTPGYDDEGSLGMMRIERTEDICRITDIAVLVVDGTLPPAETEAELIALFKKYNIPYVIAVSKTDLHSESYCAEVSADNEPTSFATSSSDSSVQPQTYNDSSIQSQTYDVSKHFNNIEDNIVYVSSVNRCGIEELKETLGRFAPLLTKNSSILEDLVNPGDLVILVTPIDESAPKGRLILPQQLVLRELLDRDVPAIVTKENTLADTLGKLSIKPTLVITDSQVFEQVNQIIPEDIPLTSFSILLSRYKGYLSYSLDSIEALKNLKNNSRILIAEGCTHHRQCKDIGTFKIPAWISEYTHVDFTFETSSGNDFPKDLSCYDLIIHCGGCMLNDKEVSYRLNLAKAQGVPFINYGIAIAQMNGILDRCVRALYPSYREHVPISITR